MKMLRSIPMLLILLMVTPLQAAVPGPLVDVKWLAANHDKVVILDARKGLKSFIAKPKYKLDKKTKKKKLAVVGGHIPGSVLVNYKKVRAIQMINGKKVTRMLPSKAAFEKLMQSVGVNQDSSIVIVSQGRNYADVTTATRLYWTLKYYGHTDMAILDGGMAAWLKARQKYSVKPAKIVAGNWKATAENKSILASSEDVAAAVKSGKAQLVDTRALSQYLGTFYKKSYVYAPGHIPRGKFFPAELVSNVKAPSHFNAVSDMKKMAAELGVKTDGKLITYCNSGHLASGAWFVVSELMGNKQARLYDGSMHQWTLEKRQTTIMKME